MHRFPNTARRSCRRRHGRRVLALAAALFTFLASPAPAALVPFGIDVTQSYMTVSQTIDASELKAGVHATVPQVGPGGLGSSDTTRLFGTLFVDLLPGSIDIGAGGEQSTIEFEATGAYAPFDPVTSDPPFPPVGVTGPAQFGLATGSPLFLAQVQYSHRTYLVSGGAVPITPGPNTFPLTPGADLMIGKKGRMAFTSALGSDTDDIIGDPVAALGTAGAAPGVFDGFMLSIPIESTFTTAIDTGDIAPGTHVYVTFHASGVIVAVPIPEPSTWLLLAFGLVGLWALYVAGGPAFEAT